MMIFELRRLTFSVATLSAVACWIGWLWLDTADGVLSPTSSRTEMLPVKLSPPLNVEQAFAAIADRPLFTHSRQPWHPAPPPPPPAEPVLAPSPVSRLEASLVGVVMSPSGNAAILRLEGGKSAVLREGSILQGWILKRVSAQRILLASPMAEEEIPFAPHGGSSSPQIEMLAATPAPARRRR